MQSKFCGQSTALAQGLAAQRRASHACPTAQALSSAHPVTQVSSPLQAHCAGTQIVIGSCA
jgi:hypothetical protein